VHFKNKNNTPYSVDNPLEYLSQRALDRRAKYAIAITEEDLPVSPYYIESVSMTGAYVSASSRWSNSVLVYAEDNMLNAIHNLDCVDKVVYVKPSEGKCKKNDTHPKWLNEKFDIPYQTRENFEYGYAYNQINQLNGVTVHKHGYTGEGMIIAVLDGGFQNADNVTGLSHLFGSGKIVMERNVVEPNRSIYDEDINDHGTMVLSCMGGNLDYLYVGTAPFASYALIRTEDAPTEYLIEEYFWMMGAEIADSLGVDIINSSLCYQEFDDPEMDHTYAEMDGKTVISSIAAKMAVERGIFVSASAGNYNGSSFPWVRSPADTPEALSLGAVNIEGEIAPFSSIGPNGAGNFKPDVVACGWGAFVLSPENLIGFVSGTSFSSPITCGMVACVIQAAPDKTPSQILEAVQKSANRYPQHDIQYGYGIPDFGKVLQLLGVLSVETYTTESNLIYYPNPVKDKLFLSNDTKIIRNVELFDIAGKLLKSVDAVNHQIFVDVKGLYEGFIFVKVNYRNGESEMVKCMVMR
jgi:subtilisin family serine protease